MAGLKASCSCSCSCFCSCSCSWRCGGVFRPQATVPRTDAGDRTSCRAWATSVFPKASRSVSVLRSTYAPGLPLGVRPRTARPLRGGSLEGRVPHARARYAPPARGVYPPRNAICNKNRLPEYYPSRCGRGGGHHRGSPAGGAAMARWGAASPPLGGRFVPRPVAGGLCRPRDRPRRLNSVPRTVAGGLRRPRDCPRRPNTVPRTDAGETNYELGTSGRR